MRTVGVRGGPARPPGPIPGAEARQPTVRLPRPIRGGRARTAKAHQLEGTARGPGPETRVVGVFMRAEKAERTERAERKYFSVLLSAFSAFSALSACARIEPPPGGPPDASPPRLIATRPNSLA